MNNFYDFIVIGAGISGCTFATFLNQRFPELSILLIEHGMKIGGRATTRKSRKSEIQEFDHGLPSINFSKYASQDIIKLISPLINSEKLVDISKNILLINELGILNNVFPNDKIYRSLPFMKNFCEEIINQSINPKKITFLFQNFTKSIQRVNDLWLIEVNNGTLLRSRNFILSSSLIAHPRCLEVLKINSLPLRDSIIPGKDKIVDAVLRETEKLTYLKRKTYIFYVSDLAVVKKFNHDYLQVFFSKIIREKLNYERIIFQRQDEGSMIITLHCSYIDNFHEINFDKIFEFLKSLFSNYREFLDVFLQAKLIDAMHWRASQPLNNLLSRELQWSTLSKIGFCGDWVDVNCRVGVESAMSSSIRLAKLLD